MAASGGSNDLSRSDYFNHPEEIIAKKYAKVLVGLIRSMEMADAERAWSSPGWFDKLFE